MTTLTRDQDLPTRFRAGEERTRCIGRPLRLLGRVGRLDEDLMLRIGRAFLERDEAGARLADAIRMREVSMDQFTAALDGDADGPVADHPALRDLVAAVTTVPAWVDWELVEEGAAVQRRLGRNAADVLLQLSLVGGYRFGGPTDLLVATGGLTGDMTLKRLAETQEWGVAVAQPGALRPGADGWRQTVHVRLMHAMVNAAFEPRWDSEAWGLPINQADLASTLGLFDGTLLVGCRALGVPFSRHEAEAVIHQWKWIGWLLGVDPDFLVDSEREKMALLYHILRAQGPLTDAGPALARAVVEAQAARRYPGWPSALQSLRARYERERLLSMLTTFLGVRSLREFGLPARPPWAFGYLWPLNTARYHLLGRAPHGKQWLESWGQRVSARILASYFRDEPSSAGAGR